MAMKEDIRRAISENLSQTIGEELRKRLDQADKDAENLDNFGAKITRLEISLEDKRGVIRGYEEQATNVHNREMAVTKGEKAVAERENEITKLELVAQYEAEKRELTVNLFNTVFANRIMKETAFVSREKVTTTNDGQGYTTEIREPTQEIEDKTTIEE